MGRTAFYIETCACPECSAEDRRKFWDAKTIWSHDEEKVREAMIKHLIASSYHYMGKEVATEICSEMEFPQYEEQSPKRPEMPQPPSVLLPIRQLWQQSRQ